MDGVYRLVLDVSYHRVIYGSASAEVCGHTYFMKDSSFNTATTCVLPSSSKSLLEEKIKIY